MDRDRQNLDCCSRSRNKTNRAGRALLDSSMSSSLAVFISLLFRARPGTRRGWLMVALTVMLWGALHAEIPAAGGADAVPERAVRER